MAFSDRMAPGRRRPSASLWVSPGRRRGEPEPGATTAGATTSMPAPNSGSSSLPPEPMRPAVVCDVNETMLDLAALDPLFASWFGEATVRREWFAQTLHFALTLAATRTYRSFAEVGAAALAAVARR